MVSTGTVLLWSDTSGNMGDLCNQRDHRVACVRVPNLP